MSKELPIKMHINLLILQQHVILKGCFCFSFKIDTFNT